MEFAVEFLEFRRLLSATLNTLVSFDGSNGSVPESGLLADGIGDFFGTTFSGGQNGGGTVFELVPSQASQGGQPNYSIDTIINFNAGDSNPVGGLTADLDGNLFGTTTNSVGGSETVYEWSTAQQIKSVNMPGLADPEANLLFDGQGNLSGTASQGGEGDGGILEVPTSFSPPIDSDSDTVGSELLFDYTQAIQSGQQSNAPSDPVGNLVSDSQGNRYGTSSAGGANDEGTVFELSNQSDGAMTLASFSSETTGQQPQSGLIGDSRGNFYGTAEFGGANGDGTIFAFSTVTDTITALASFDGADGSEPRGDLIADADGDLFGTTFAGGTDGLGTVFELPVGSNTAVVLGNFTGSNGSGPTSALVVDADGNLYGTTRGGGTSGDGTVFEVSDSGFAVPTIQATPPVNQPVSAGVATPVRLGTIVSDGGQGPYVVDVDWGDGSADTRFVQQIDGSIAPQMHTFGTTGTSTVSETVTDANGFKSTATMFDVTVAPSIVVTPSTAQLAPVLAGTTLQQLDLGSFSEFGATAPFTVDVNWGDGSSDTIFTQQDAGFVTPQAHTFTVVGADSVSVTVTDANDVTSNAAAFKLTVIPSIIVASPADQSSIAEAAESFNLGSFSEIGGSAPYTVDVNWGDGSADTTFTQNATGALNPQSHTFAAAGSDSASVTITDANGFLSNTEVFSILVGASSPLTVGGDVALSIIRTTLPSTFVAGELASATLELTNDGSPRAVGDMQLQLLLAPGGVAADGTALSAPTLNQVPVNLAKGRRKAIVAAFTVPSGVTLGDNQLIVQLTPVSGFSGVTFAANTIAQIGSETAALEFGHVAVRAGVRLVDTIGTAAVRFTLAGAGTGSLVPDASGGFAVSLTGTTLGSSVTITSATAVTLNGMSDEDPVGPINAAGIGFDGAVSLNGGVSSLRAGNFSGSTITLGGVHAATMTLGNLSDSSIVCTAAIANLKINSFTNGGVAGSITALRLMALTDAGDFDGTLAIDGNIGSVSILESLTGDILAGALLGNDHQPGGGNDTFSSAVISSLRIDGDVTNSIIAAGLNVRDDVFPLDGTETVLSDSKIASLLIDGTLSADSTVISANLPHKITIAGVQVATATDPRFND